MLESGKSVADTASDMPVSRHMIERWRSNCIPLHDKPPRKTSSESDNRTLSDTLIDPCKKEKSINKFRPIYVCVAYIGLRVWWHN